MKNIILRKAEKLDMSSIETYIERFRLDDENTSFEQFIVAIKEGNIIGFGRIKPYKSCFELGCLGVLEPYRNQGIGAAIVRKLIQNFPSDEIWITTDIPKYFEQFGFNLTEDAPKEIKDKIKGMCQIKQHPDAVIMLLQKRRKRIIKCSHRSRN